MVVEYETGSSGHRTLPRIQAESGIPLASRRPLARRLGGDLFTTAISWFSWLQRNYRMAYPVLREANRLRWVRDALGSYVWFTPSRYLQASV